MISPANDTHTLILQRLQSVFSTIPFNKLLGFRLEHLSAEKVIITFSAREELIGNFHQGILHGGVISSVLDSAGGMLAMSVAAYKHADRSQEEIIEAVGKCSTVDLQISYLRPGRGKSYTASAQVLKSGNRLCFIRMDLHNHENTLIATANGTFTIG